MFDVEASHPHGITVRGHSDGHRWVFAIHQIDDQLRGLALLTVIRNPDTTGDCEHQSSDALAYAEVEAWKRGLID